MQPGTDPTQWRKLLDQANSGQLRLDPEVGKGLDQVCDNYLAQLGTALRMTASVKDVSGFGPFPSGQALQEKFRLKASGSEQSLEAVLKQHIDSVQIAKQVVAKAISNFVESDQRASDQISGTAPR